MKNYVPFERYLNIFAVFFSFGFVLIMIIISQNNLFINPVDYEAYVNAIEGDFSGYYYPYWILALIFPFTKLPYIVGYALWAIINIFGLLYATKVFKGRIWLLILNYQFLWVLYYGQIVGIVVAGIAFYWFHIKDRPILSGIGAVIALAKPHIAVPLLIGIALTRTSKWSTRLLSTTAVCIATVISLAISPNWISELIHRIINAPPIEMGSISLWHSIGALSLILWGGIFLPISHKEKLILIIVIPALTFPYYQQSGLLILYTFSVSYLPLLGNISFLFPVLENTEILKLSVLVPLSIYIYITLKCIIKIARKSRI
jgi:hypothetical protein